MLNYVILSSPLIDKWGKGGRTAGCTKTLLAIIITSIALGSSLIKHHPELIL